MDYGGMTEGIGGVGAADMHSSERSRGHRRRIGRLHNDFGMA